jgi:hypothetical protein
MRTKGPALKCKDCKFWYGAEDDEVGPCSIKHMRGDKAFLTHGMFDCDEEEGSS